jgi:sugar/nucleoside kinase (ribokinase family)
MSLRPLRCKLGAMPASRIQSALVLGAVTRDLESGRAAAPGGVVHYAGRAFAALGARTRVVTRVRNADAAELLSPLVAAGVEVRALPSAATTTYANDYSGAEDHHELLAASDPIGPDDLPAAWRSADAIHLGPLHRRDLSPGTLASLSGFTGIDLQGLVRLADERGTRLAPNPELKDFLAYVSVAKASEEEIAVLLEGRSLEAFRSEFGLAELLVTRGERGVLVVTRWRVEEIATPPVPRRFPVGAGDVFLAAYLHARASDRSPVTAARFAVRTSAVHVEHGRIPDAAGAGDAPK